MVLKELIKNIEILSSEGELDLEVKGLALSSKDVKEGFLFFAVSGNKQDGHVFIEGAITGGATSIICERIPENTHVGVTYVQVKNTNDVVGIIASEFFGRSTEKLIVVGVTGTNGKTTIATMLYKLFTNLGFKSGLISTIENRIGDEVIPTIYTTPDAVSLQSMFAKMVEEDCTHAFMEVSSHAVDQGRIKGINFRGAIFTNLTQDHLDYHETLEEYAKAKKKFFDDLEGDSFALYNLDDGRGQFMVSDTHAKKVSYGEDKGDFNFKILNSSKDGLQLSINGLEIKTPLVGKFNAYNIAAIFGAASELGITSEKLKEILATLEGARGRMEKVIGKNGVLGLVDYSHTPDALKNALETVNGFKGSGKVITIFGAGGDRDKTKRPQMGKIAAELSDEAIVTSDNPRSENPNTIIEEILAGISDKKNISVELDRKLAIKKGIELAKPGDIVLVAGKGHEDYQEIAGIKTHFSDLETLKELL